MPHYLIQAGSKLQKMTTAGVITDLTLPADVVISTTRRGHFALLQRQAVFVNGATKNLWIDENGVVRPMSLRAPSTPPLLSQGSAGGLTGTFKAAVANGIKDEDGKVLALSPFGPLSDALTIASKEIDVTGVFGSFDTDVNFRRVYRTTDGGNVLFQWEDLDGNRLTSFTSDMSDARLEQIAAPTDLGNPPGTIGGDRLTLIEEWKGHLWAVSSGRPDFLRNSAFQKFYAWPETSEFLIPPEGSDTIGVTAIVPRRDELGIAKRDMFAKITGNVESNFARIIVVQGAGIVAPESVVVKEDIMYGLGLDGVYRWGPDGFKNISDDRVKSWFTTDTTFNRAQFPNAFAKWHEQYSGYDLHLAASGSSDIDRWVLFQPASGKWYGPHKTAAFTPTAAQELQDSNLQALPVIASSNGFLWKTQSTRTDDTGTAIDYDVLGKFHHADAPMVDKFFGLMDVISAIESSGTVTVTPALGGLDASAGTAFSHDLTKGRERLGYLSEGESALFCQLRFQNNVAGIDVRLYGYEVEWHSVGMR